MSEKTERKNIYFPSGMISEVNNLSKRLKMDFSKFVREATAEYVKYIKRIELERELEEGYKAKAKLNLRISDDFRHVDGENIE